MEPLNSELMLVIFVIVGLIGRSPLIATASSLLLIMKLIHLDRWFPTIERRGLEFGLLFLTIAILVPFATGRITFKEVLDVFSSTAGIFALLGGLLATYLNGKGLDLLKFDPHLTVGMVIGSIFGILFLRGIPVGPLMAAAITSLFMKLFQFLWD